MPSPILTDGAIFTCGHKGVATSPSISNLASNVTIGGHKPILAGAIISGTFAGCTWPALSGVGAPACSTFSLPPPSEASVTIGGVPVYTAADETAIALASDSVNGQVGMSISESQTLVTA